MQIRSSLFLAAGTSLILIAGLIVSTSLVRRELGRAASTQRLAHQITVEASAQMSLTLEYILYAEPRALHQWEKRLEVVDDQLKQLPFEDNVQREARYHFGNISSLFYTLVKIRDAEQTDLTRMRMQLVINQLIANSQAFLDLINRWSEKAQQRRMTLEGIFQNFIVAFQVTILLLLLLLASLLRRRVLRPLRNFHAAVKSVSKGDLSVHADTGSHDELGELSRAFDAMAIDLVAHLRNEIRNREAAERKLQQLATTDPLTEIANRRHFLAEARAEIAKAERYHEQFCVIMFDIDHFKQVNDEYGHDVGDQVLIELVRLVSSQIREVDLFARWGGEEFLVLLPNTKPETGLNLAHRLRQQIEAHDFEGPPHLTISLGIARYQPSESLESFLKRADVALYQAKNQGRNRVVEG